jgi:hypothetical protein
LLKLFTASRDGYKAPLPERHRLEGFMQGAIFMGYASSKQLAALMERVHFTVFGKTISQHQQENRGFWQENDLDYGQYDQPTYERKR